MKFPTKTFRAIAASTVLLGLTLSSPNSAFAAEGKTGTDPRDFAPKFMPYYRYTELENGLEEQTATIFGLYAFSKRFAMTYEIPLAKKRDINNTSLKDPATGLCGGLIQPGPGLPAIPVGGAQGDQEGDCQETGTGDMNLRFMYRMKKKALGGDWIIGSQFDFPTATDDTLGAQQFKIGPMFAYVRDLEAYPAPGAFAALMNFYFFDAFGEDALGSTSMYVGRWFVMLPLRKPGPGFLDGWYLLPEFQPIYDFEQSHFSFWGAPELGKVLAPGNILYIKPGWGADPDGDLGDRKFTFEVGYRLFL